MSDGKRRRYRKIRDEKEKRPIILAKREDTAYGNSSQRLEGEIQPKILLKTKANDLNDLAATGGAAGSTLGVPLSSEGPLKTIIVTRSENAQSPALTAGNVSPNTTREQQQQQQPAGGTVVDGNNPVTIIEPVPQMNRPATVISSTGLINANARKLLLKNNTEFLVVGVVGTQGVGKSTILNLLANELTDYDYHKRVFVEEDAVFRTKLKQHKCSARSRTESMHMFCTNDRLILLDSPPVLCNSYKKDMTTNELDDLRNIITLLSVCHLLIVVQDDYVNVNFIRLLQFAELMKPMQDAKPFLSDYLPNLLFVKNRAKRQDFMPESKARYDRMLRAFFKDTQLRIHPGQTTTVEGSQRLRLKGKQPPSPVGGVVGSNGSSPEKRRPINSFLLPEVKGPEATPYHGAIDDLITELRNLVFMTPRNDMCQAAAVAEFTETVWFDLLAKVSQDKQHFFSNTYEDIQRGHFESSGGCGPNNPNANALNSTNQMSRDTQESWRD